MTGGSYFAPMLASPLDGQSLDRFHPADWWLEEKFDGERVTTVVDDAHNVAAWSRPGPKNKTGIGLSRILPATIRDTMAAFPPGTFDGEEVGGKLVLFDVTAIDGETLTRRPASERREILDSLASGLAACRVTCVQVAPVLPVSLQTVEDIWARGGEGAILKRRGGLYLPGKRSRDWVKVKKEQTAALTITGFEPAKRGPHSVLTLVDDDGITTTVGALNVEELRRIDLDPRSYIGRRLLVEFTEKTVHGRYRHPRWKELIPHASTDLHL